MGSGVEPRWVVGRGWFGRLVFLQHDCWPEGEGPKSATERWKPPLSAADRMCLGRRGSPLQPERGGQTRLSLSGKVVWVSSPLLRLHCDTNLNQSVPKKKEKYLTLLLQPFKTSCPRSDFAKSFVRGAQDSTSLLYPPGERAPGCTSISSRWSNARACSGTDTYVLWD